MAARIPGSVRPDAADYLNLDTKPTVHYTPDVSNTEDIMSQFRDKNVKRPGPEPEQEEEGDSDIEVEVND